MDKWTDVGDVRQFCWRGGTDESSTVPILGVFQVRFSNREQSGDNPLTFSVSTFLVW